VNSRRSRYAAYPTVPAEARINSAVKNHCTVGQRTTGPPRAAGGPSKRA
jgi:hypothetical protein